MTEPTAPLIARLDSLIAQQTETNALLRRIVPDDRVFPGGLYDLLRFGLYRAVPDAMQPEGFTFTSLPDAIRQFLYREASQESATDLLFQIAGSTFDGATASNEAVSLLSNLRTFLDNQLNPGTLTLNVIEQLNAIRENTGSEENGSILDALNVLAQQGRTLVTVDGGLQTYTIAELLYALAICSCESFPPSLPPPPIPPEQRATCLDGTNADPFEFQAYTRVSLGTHQFLGMGFRFYAFAFNYPGPLSAQGKAYNAVPGGGDVPFIVSRDGSQTWVSFADYIGITVPNEFNDQYYFGWTAWPYNVDVPSTPDMQAIVNAWSPSQYVSTNGTEACVNLGDIPVLQPGDEDLPTVWRAIIFAVDEMIDEIIIPNMPVIRSVAPPGDD